MTFINRLSDWLERHWVVPAYVGWVLLGLALFFFAAATNTLAGWLYVMSGVLLALLIIAAVLPSLNLNGLHVQRQPIQPVSAGASLLIELHLTNPQSRAKGLFEAIDQVPAQLGMASHKSFGNIPGGKTQVWRYDLQTTRRGVYHWQNLDLRSAAPLGLFWCRRSLTVPATAVVYPQILSLHRCPILDNLGQQTGHQWHRNQSVQLSTEGITRSLRPYRWGDPTRLIHWRTSARYGELRIRELERVIDGQEVLIALDIGATWNEAAFEQAIVAAASLYAYAFKQGFAAALWLPKVGILRDYSSVLAALAAVDVMPIALNTSTDLPGRPLIFLTANQLPLEQLPIGSRQLCWVNGAATSLTPAEHTLWMNPAEPLQPQLQTLS